LHGILLIAVVSGNPVIAAAAKASEASLTAGNRHD
jgi:hypothetical protein